MAVVSKKSEWDAVREKALQNVQQNRYPLSLMWIELVREHGEYGVQEAMDCVAEMLEYMSLEEQTRFLQALSVRWKPLFDLLTRDDGDENNLFNKWTGKGSRFEKEIDLLWKQRQEEIRPKNYRAYQERVIEELQDSSWEEIENRVRSAYQEIRTLSAKVQAGKNIAKALYTMDRQPRPFNPVYRYTIEGTRGA